MPQVPERNAPSGVAVAIAVSLLAICGCATRDDVQTAGSPALSLDLDARRPALEGRWQLSGSGCEVHTELSLGFTLR